MTTFTLLRRLAIFVMAILVLSLAGLGLLLFRWRGESGAPPAGRLYLNGDFESDGPLLVMQKVAEGNACYEVQSSSPRPLGEGPGVRAPRICRGSPQRIWIEDALVDVTIGARGVPRISIDGLRAREGEWIGSLADRKRPHPRYPIRAYGVPALAAQVVSCPSDGGGLCLAVHDRGGRLALVRGGRVERLAYGRRYAPEDGDVLWLGLVPFEIEIEHQAAALVLRRQDRPRLGGDRRWLGRLWHVEAPDPAAATPARFEIHPMRERYTTHNLSRQRTNFEGEDVVQRLIDGGWLCLDNGEVRWRALEEPGCAEGWPSPGITRSAMTDYRRARYGDLSYVAGSLVSAANAALAEENYLEDATALPLAFDWTLAYRDGDVGDRRPQPVPHSLWGVRFGATRQIRSSAAFRQGILPTVVPRASTGRHLVEVTEGGELVSSFYLPAGAKRGSICLGRHPKGSAEPYRATSGSHLPLGSVAFDGDPRQGTWTADADAGCEGCRLAAEDGLRGSGDCERLERGAEDGLVRWGPYSLRAIDRGRPWLAATDPGSRRRHFAEELYLRGALRPLVGDEAGLSGVEAALRDYLEDSGEIGVSPQLATLELTIDGDLQLTAAGVVDALARRYVTAENDPEPDRVSVTAAVLDAGSGELLAAVSWSRRGSERARASDWGRPTAWELGSGQADVLENAALLRRGAIGSTMKITDSYALLNSGSLGDGPALGRARRGHAFLEAGERGQLLLQRGGQGRPSVRRCSTGPHYLPADDRGFTVDTFVDRFAESCNNFFVLTGFRHASAMPARLRRSSASVAGPGELLIADGNVLVQPPSSERVLVERLRDGLAADAAAEVPRSLYGVLFRLGFQPRSGSFPGRGEAPAELAFEHGGGRVAVPLVHDWFSPTGGAVTLALEPGRDFAYPGVPSPGRLDVATVRGEAATELYDGATRAVRRRADDGRADVQYSMLVIGQAGVEASAVGLAALYAPAARADGRAVAPCLFRANCGDRRAGARVLANSDGVPLNEALHAVVRRGTARGGLARMGLAELPARGWGGKTGTYEVERREPVGLSRAGWRRLRAWACGVGDARPPRIRGDGSRVRRLAAELAEASRGSALGARTCEEPDLPLNPAGVHRYRSDAAPSRLDELARELERTAAKKTETYHSFVALVPPERGGWPAVSSPAEGIVVAVLVDRETEEKPIAVEIGGELAAAVERWAALAR